ncbi:MAG: DUF1292 domain-containing protein [Clostridia bacterium]|nr:DUF1292 domain-containing protein [Clostridia bacterium]
MKEEKKEVVNEANALDALFDANNNANITLYNEKDEPVEFEQIAIIPLNDRVYAILKPTADVEGVADDEAFVFEVVEDEENGDSLRLVEDDKVIDAVFADYNKLLDEQDDED